jgi:hypothetical protein
MDQILPGIFVAEEGFSCTDWANILEHYAKLSPRDLTPRQSFCMRKLLRRCKIDFTMQNGLDEDWTFD